MPSLISHAVVGLSFGKIFPLRNLPKRFWTLSLISPALADADVIAFFFGIPYNHPFGHRGFFHSVFFALILSIIIVSVFFRHEKYFSGRWIFLFIYFFVLNSTHGLLDAFTSGGLGIALLAPFDNTRYFFPFTPIQVSPLSITAFFSEWGLRVILSEVVWVWFPSLVMVVTAGIIRTVFLKKKY